MRPKSTPGVRGVAPATAARAPPRYRKDGTRESSQPAEKGMSMTSSLALLQRQTRSPGNFDLRFWFLLALPVAGLALAVAVMWISDGSAGDISSAIFEVTGSGI